MQFPFSPCVLFLSLFGSSIPPVIYLFLLFIVWMAHFSKLNSISLSWMEVPEVPEVRWLSSFELDWATRVQILDDVDCISHRINTLGKSTGWPPPKKKNRTHIFLAEIHKFNFSLFFFFRIWSRFCVWKIGTIVFTNMSWSTKEKTFCVEAYFANKSYTVVQANFRREFRCRNAPSKSRIGELKAAITAKIMEIPREECMRGIDNFVQRLLVCLQRRGGHLEHILMRP